VNEDSPVIESQKKSSVLGKLSKLLAILVILGFIVVGAAFFYSVQYFTGHGSLNEEKIVDIPEGSSLKAIAAKLADENVISYPEIFTAWIRITKPEKTMKAGQYRFEANISPEAVFHKLEQGDVIKYSLTIPEGLMTSQIIKLINEAPNMSGKITSDVKEGELLPETYEYTHNYDRQKLVERMKASMQKALDEAWEKRADNLPIKSKEEALILASIIEKETGVSSERERVAGVFINRLNKGMRLQTDPTVIYAITKGEYVLERLLSRKDLKSDSPYNTYENFGLPPTPIANPGKKSVEAALNPMQTDEYYFVADGTGGHKFSATLKEHNKAVQKWRKISRENKEKSNQQDVSN